ncbi:hypothetical protein EV356DRAFT_532406 [Viridothelium virens]|uniref:CorA-like transporter domain-containing protein n=1 Tax=Viridothelium virens TaxID=1048519 RepID=A0A6A6H9Q6_VIRVR|nr:hypothetical protein EV356DRAFT_532406 [Viridothelium virens]
MHKYSQFDGWEKYPESLCTDDDESWYAYNHESYNEQLRGDSLRLFVQKCDPIVIKVIEIGVHVTEKQLEDATALEIYLKQHMGDGLATRVILIPQQSSWGQLVIDEDSMRKLLTYFNVFPPFLDVIRAFGQRTSYEDESYGGLHFRSGKSTAGLEIAYLIKHVERHGKLQSEEPWSIRQMGVYHKYGGPSGDVFIIINPSIPLQRRLADLKKCDGTDLPQKIHMAILSCMMENWRWYISDLEKRYVHMKERAQLARVNGIRWKALPMAEIRFEDIQAIQFLQDKFQELAHVFDMDRRILRDLQNRLGMLTAGEHRKGDDSDLLRALLADSNIQMSRINSMLKRLDATIALVRTILDFQCWDSLKNNSQSMSEMAKLTQMENKLIVELTQKASRDTDILKTLTLLALTYLPASLASSMMGMNYINIKSTKENRFVQIDGEFWVFIVLTSVLLSVTFGAYVWYLRRHRAYLKNGHAEKEA